MACIPKHLVAEFMNRVKSGEMTPEKLELMSSVERHKYFASFLGEQNAKFVNASFEEKVILQARKNAGVKWVMDSTGMTEHVKKDIVSRIERLGTVMTPEAHDKFLADLVARKMGMGVTMNEAANLAALAKEVVDKESAFAKDASKENRLSMGAARIAFKNYHGGLRDKAQAKTLAEYVFKPQNWVEGFFNLAGGSKTILTTFLFDNSFFGRQGLITLTRAPDIWGKNFVRSFKDFIDILRGVEVLDAVQAEIFSRDNYNNGAYQKAGLAIGTLEEAVTTVWFQQLPFVGRLFKAPQDTYTAATYRIRADLFDRFYADAEKRGADPEGMGILMNGMTGRAHLGGLEQYADRLNKAFFAPRWLMANIDFLTFNVRNYKRMSPYVRQQAAINVLYTAVSIATFLLIAKAFDDDSVELDPRSSASGKVKINGIYHNVSGGLGSLVTYIARVMLTSTKNTQEQIVNDFSNKPGAPNFLKVTGAFIRGKASPLAGILIDRYNNETFDGTPPTISGEMKNLTVPINARNAVEMYENDTTNPLLLLSLISDAAGFGTNIYNDTVDWSTKTGKEMIQFRDKVGDARFKEANEMYNEDYKDWFDGVRDSQDYADMEDDEKREFLQGGREKIKNRVFKKYNFRYKKQKR